MVIVVDSNEAAINTDIFDELSKHTVVKKEPLPAGDYLIGELLIERKTSMDLVNSVRGNRLWNEVFKLKLAERYGYKPILLLEGSPTLPVKRRGWGEEQVIGILYTATIANNIQLIYSPTKKWTVKTLLHLNRKHGDKTDSRKLQSAGIKKPTDICSVIRAMIESVPGVGPNKAHQLLEYFGSLYNLVTAEVFEIRLPRVVSDELAALLYVLFHFDYAAECRE